MSTIAGNFSVPVWPKLIALAVAHAITDHTHSRKSTD